MAFKDFEKLKGTQTEKNLQEAYSGESQAHVKYTYYASQAKKDGYVQISNIFEETARNEKEHAKLWFKLLHEGKVPKTTINLQDAADGEFYEYSDMYPSFAKVACGYSNLTWWYLCLPYIKLVLRLKKGFINK